MYSSLSSDKRRHSHVLQIVARVTPGQSHQMFPRIFITVVNNTILLCQFKCKASENIWFDHHGRTGPKRNLPRSLEQQLTQKHSDLTHGVKFQHREWQCPGSEEEHRRTVLARERELLKAKAGSLTPRGSSAGAAQTLS